MKTVKFAVDGMLGRLARWLRLCGFDAVYVNSRQPSDILGLGRKEERFILTRSSFLKEHEPGRVYRVKSDRIREQLEEIIQHFQLKIKKQALFNRCSLCNCLLEKVERVEIKEKVPSYICKIQREFYRCQSCRRIYWSGTHWKHILEFLTKEIMR